jgi:hypothetical protein
MAAAPMGPPPMARALAPTKKGLVSRARTALFGDADRAAPKSGSSGAMERAAPPAELDPVHELLMSQRFDGSFASPEVLTRALGDDARLREALAKHDAALVCTAVAVRWLEQTQRARRDEWLPAVKKARAWLDAQPASFEASAVL